LSPKRLGMRIKRLRETRGMTQEKLAKRLRVSRVHIANIESANSAAHHRTPSLALLERIAKVFGVPVTELLE
jgi:transcriptional regulator with XRE-family HTH domain